jgi:alkylated DNA repair dioxygenase AlkB
MESVFLSGPWCLKDVVQMETLPTKLRPDATQFEALWALHPRAFHTIMTHGRLVPTPRWQQAYGADYRYAGNTNPGLPVIPPMEPFLNWARHAIEPRLNGLLFNWYDGRLGHYIGAHRDSTAGVVVGTPIVTISLGEARVFRLRPYKGKGFIDIPVADSMVLVIPWEVNARFTHEVPASRHAKGRRISITLRAFERPQSPLPRPAVH